MTAAAQMRRGWCPGVLRPMQTGDGLLVRLRLTAGVLPVGLARRIADWARRFGNGQIDLSQRGNLQLRGVTEATLPALTDALAGAGLIDPSPAAEAVRNVLASPLAGIDPAMPVDVRPIAAALAALLAATPELHRLPTKFTWIVDGGGSLPLDGIDADVRFRANGDGRFAVGLQRSDGVARLQAIGADEIVQRAGAIARWFLGLGDGLRRMRDVPDAALPSTPTPSYHRSHDARRMAGAVMASGSPIAVLAGLPFGRTDADGLLALTRVAAKHGVGELRLTPFRAIALPLRSNGLIADLAQAGFITDPADSRLAIIACSGAPFCASASTSTLADAGRIARALAGRNPVPDIHVSGCAKGCAHPHGATITLVGSDGGYGLVRDGSAREEPTEWLTSADVATRIPSILGEAR